MGTGHSDIAGPNPSRPTWRPIYSRRMGGVDGGRWPGGKIRRAARATLVIGAACLAIFTFMIVFTRPADPRPPATIGTASWTLISHPRECVAGDAGYSYAGSLTNHTAVALDATVRVAFSVGGRREATGTGALRGLAPSTGARFEIIVAASFPDGLPEPRCRAEVDLDPG